MSLKRNTPMPRGEGPKRTPMPPRKARLRQAADPARAFRKPAVRRDTGPSRKVRAVIWKRAGGACESCGVSVAGRPYSIQHIIARGMGGTSDPDANALFNLVLLCGTATTPGSCHALAESRDPGMRARGFWAYSWENPAVKGITLADGTTVLLGAKYLTVPPEEAAA